MTQTYTIGELGRLTDTKVETVRYYERVGLLPHPPRSSGNYRVYDDAHLGRLGFIRRARELGFSLDQVRELLDLAGQTTRSCEEVDEIVQAHVTDIERRIHDLQTLRQELTQLLAQCQHGKVAECRIIGALQPYADRPTAG
ncbi:HTH-type transcriptional regulator ZntR [Komagataeibacter saccharivorans]|uniref:MerR family transcriptional regulator n=1 Tax=Komagataeibacter saccharivorans TaxID=265959 RepID=UPI001043B808|nr:helix-turn-helix domain-containing protein [Komagataeibacter saccharivorans]QBL94979.1 HTH-type transcriptional regulator ZntR [Komagataeibacter saccharivorans]